MCRKYNKIRLINISLLLSLCVQQYCSKFASVLLQVFNLLATIRIEKLIENSFVLIEILGTRSGRLEKRDSVIRTILKAAANRALAALCFALALPSPSYEIDVKFFLPSRPFRWNPHRFPSCFIFRCPDRITFLTDKSFTKEIVVCVMMETAYRV